MFYFMVEAESTELNTVFLLLPVMVSGVSSYHITYPPVPIQTNSDCSARHVSLLAHP